MKRNDVFWFSMVHYRRTAKHHETMWGGIAGGKTRNLLKNKEVRRPAKPWTAVRFRSQPPHKSVNYHIVKALSGAFFCARQGMKSRQKQPKPTGIGLIQGWKSGRPRVSMSKKPMTPVIQGPATVATIKL